MANTLTASNLQMSLKRGGKVHITFNDIFFIHGFFNGIHGFLMIFIFLFFSPCLPTQILSWSVQETGNQFGLAQVYLLMHAYRAIEDSPKLYDQWLQVLSKHVASVEVLDEVRQGHLLLMAPQVQVSSQTMRLAEGIGHDIMEMGEVFPANAEKPDRVAIGAKRPRSLNIFTEQHIPILIEKLAACAGKWSEISIVLGLPEHIRHDLCVMCVTWNSMACFNRLLWEWIVGKHSGAKDLDPTLENLEEVLKSQAVGLGGEANQLRRSLAQSGIHFEVDEQQPTLPKKPRHESLPLEIVRQSSSAIVTEGKSTLLEKPRRHLIIPVA